jgi:hypothetical protein
MAQGFFRRAGDGNIVFGPSSKHKGERIEDVAKSDPNYLRWSWKERTVGLPTDIFEKIGEVMETFGVSFTRKKKS